MSFEIWEKYSVANPKKYVISSIHLQSYFKGELAPW